MSHYMLLISIALGFSLNTLAKDDHTANFCSATDAKVCAHIGHMTGMKTKNDAEFIVDIVVPKAVTNFKADLWMPEHDHGTSPVTISPYKKNKYKIQKAVFSMTGKWHARISFDLDKVNHKIEIPLTIGE